MRNLSDELWRLLPYNATDLEQDILRAAPFDEVLQPAFARIAGAKGLLSPGRRLFVDDVPLVDSDGMPIITSEEGMDYFPINDTWPAWMAIELDVNKFSEFISNPIELVSRGLELNRLAGTSKAIKEAMLILGYGNSTVWEHSRSSVHFPEYHIGLGQVPSFPWECCKVHRFAMKLQPVRSRLRRLFSGWDDREFYLSESKFGEALLSDYSGIPIDPVSPCAGGNTNMAISFRRLLTSAVEDEPDLAYDFYRIRLHDHRVGRESRFPVLDEDFTSGFDAKSFYDSAFAVGESLQAVVTDQGDNILDDEGNVILY